MNNKTTNLSNYIFNMFWSLDKWNIEDRATVLRICDHFNTISDDKLNLILNTEQIKKKLE